MTILSYKTGPGTLTIGAVPLDVSEQVTSCTLQWEEKVDTIEAVDVLSGGQLPEEETASYKAKLVATFLQDTLATGGLVDYSWTNKGSSVAFKFIPAAANAKKITGTLRVMPIDVGGDVKARATSSVTFACVGTVPALSATP